MQYAIDHMNNDHQDALLAMAKHFGDFKKVTSVTLTKIEGKEIFLKVNGEEVLTIPLAEPATKENVKALLISLTKEAKMSLNQEKIEKLSVSANDFMNSFKSAILATTDKQNQAYATYAPILNYNGDIYIYISEIADHHSNLSSNPNLEILFLEDESLAKLIVLRKRLRFRAKAEFIKKDGEYENILNAFEEKVDSTVKTLRTMKDFHLVKLHLQDGRYVKGFGQAYDITYDKSKGCIAGSQITSNKENQSAQAHGGVAMPHKGS